MIQEVTKGNSDDGQQTGMVRSKKENVMVGREESRVAEIQRGE
jgi:hypothetical protein